ncbi:hypothetical protein EMIT0158MI4_130189 [Burkholderia ambifaria]
MLRLGGLPLPQGRRRTQSEAHLAGLQRGSCRRQDIAEVIGRRSCGKLCISRCGDPCQHSIQERLRKLVRWRLRRKQDPVDERCDDVIHQRLARRWGFAARQRLLADHVQLFLNTVRALPRIERIGAAQHVAQQCPADFRRHLLKILGKPVLHILPKLTRVRRQTVGQEMLDRHVGKQLRQVTPAPVDGGRRHTGARRDRWHGQAIPTVFLLQSTDRAMHGFLHARAAATRPQSLSRRHGRFDSFMQHIEQRTPLKQNVCICARPSLY